MKKITLILVLLATLLVFSNSYAVNWHKADSAVIGWDAVTTYYDGTPLPGDTQGINYYIYTKDVNGNNPRLEANVLNITTATITLAEGEKKYVGISASVIDVDGIVSDDSVIAWSDDPIYCLDGIVFGVHNLKRSSPPKNLHKK